MVMKLENISFPDRINLLYASLEQLASDVIQTPGQTPSSQNAGVLHVGQVHVAGLNLSFFVYRRVPSGGQECSEPAPRDPQPHLTPLLRTTRAHTSTRRHE